MNAYMLEYSTVTITVLPPSEWLPTRSVSKTRNHLLCRYSRRPRPLRPLVAVAVACVVVAPAVTSQLWRVLWKVHCSTYSLPQQNVSPTVGLDVQPPC